MIWRGLRTVQQARPFAVRQFARRSGPADKRPPPEANQLMRNNRLTVRPGPEPGHGDGSGGGSRLMYQVLGGLGLSAAIVLYLEVLYSPGKFDQFLPPAMRIENEPVPDPEDPYAASSQAGDGVDQEEWPAPPSYENPDTHDPYRGSQDEQDPWSKSNSSQGGGKGSWA